MYDSFNSYIKIKDEELVPIQSSHGRLQAVIL